MIFSWRAKVVLKCLRVLRTAQWPRTWEWCVDGAGVGVFLELGGQIGLVHVPHTWEWIGVLGGCCSPSSWWFPDIAYLPSLLQLRNVPWEPWWDAWHVLFWWFNIQIIHNKHETDGALLVLPIAWCELAVYSLLSWVASQGAPAQWYLLEGVHTFLVVHHSAHFLCDWSCLLNCICQWCLGEIACASCKSIHISSLVLSGRNLLDRGSWILNWEWILCY